MPQSRPFERPADQVVAERLREQLLGGLVWRGDGPDVGERDLPDRRPALLDHGGQFVGDHAQLRLPSAEQGSLRQVRQCPQPHVLVVADLARVEDRAQRVPGRVEGPVGQLGGPPRELHQGQHRVRARRHERPFGVRGEATRLVRRAAQRVDLGGCGVHGEHPLWLPGLHGQLSGLGCGDDPKPGVAEPSGRRRLPDERLRERSERPPRPQPRDRLRVQPRTQGEGADRVRRHAQQLQVTRADPARRAQRVEPGQRLPAALHRGDHRERRDDLRVVVGYGQPFDRIEHGRAALPRGVGEEPAHTDPGQPAQRELRAVTCAHLVEELAEVGQPVHAGPHEMQGDVAEVGEPGPIDRREVGVLRAADEAFEGGAVA